MPTFGEMMRQSYGVDGGASAAGPETEAEPMDSTVLTSTEDGGRAFVPDAPAAPKNFGDILRQSYGVGAGQSPEGTLAGDVAKGVRDPEGRLLNQDVRQVQPSPIESPNDAERAPGRVESAINEAARHNPDLSFDEALPHLQTKYQGTRFQPEDQPLWDAYRKHWTNQRQAAEDQVDLTQPERMIDPETIQGAISKIPSAPLRSMAGGLVGAAGKLARVGAGFIGDGKTRAGVDQYLKQFNNDLGAAVDESNKDASGPTKFIASGLGALTDSLATAATGGPAALGLFATESAQTAGDAADKAGVKGWAKTGYVGANALLAAMAGKVAQGALGGAMGQTGGKVLSVEGVKALGNEFAHDAAMLGVQDFGGKLAEAFSGVDPDAMNPENLIRSAGNILRDAVMFRAAGSGPRVASEIAGHPMAEHAATEQASPPSRDSLGAEVKKGSLAEFLLDPKNEQAARDYADSNAERAAASDLGFDRTSRSERQQAQELVRKKFGVDARGMDEEVTPEKKPLFEKDTKEPEQISQDEFHADLKEQGDLSSFRDKGEDETNHGFKKVSPNTETAKVDEGEARGKVTSEEAVPDEPAKVEPSAKTGKGWIGQEGDTGDVERPKVPEAEGAGTTRRAFGKAATEPAPAVEAKTSKKFGAEKVQPEKPAEKTILGAAVVPPLPEKVSTEVHGFLGRAADAIKGVSLPKILALSKNAANAVAEHAAAMSRSAGEAKAKKWENQILGPNADENTRKFVGAALTERMLREQKAKFEATGENEKAAAVKTMVGEKLPFKDEADYKAALKDKRVTKAIDAIDKLMGPESDELFRRGFGIGPDEELNTTSGRISLLRAEQPQGRALGGKLGAAIKAVTPFGRGRTGASETGYEVDLRKMLENQAHNSLQAATRVKMFDSLVKEGLAAWDTKDAQVRELGGEPTRSVRVEVPVRHETEDGTFSTKVETKNLNVRESVADEVETAMKLPGNKVKMGTLAKGVNAFNTLGFGSLVPEVLANKSRVARWIKNVTSVASPEAATHVLNLIKTPASRGGATDSALKDAALVTGLNVPQVVGRIAYETRNLLKGDSATMEALDKIASIGAGRPSHSEGATTPIEAIDAGTRLLMNKMYDNLVKQGLYDAKDDASRREFINQLGQYNDTLQTGFERFIKKTGFAPFVTAGTTMNRNAAKTIFGASAGDAVSGGQAAKQRAADFSRNIMGTIAVAAAVEALLWRGQEDKKPKDWVPGTIRLPSSDGKDRRLSMWAYTLAGRGGRATGAAPLAQGLIEGKSQREIADDMFKTMANSLSHPIAGPLLQAGATAMTGHEFRVGGRPVPKVEAGNSQNAANVKQAFKHVSQFGSLTEEGSVGQYGENAAGVYEHKHYPGQALTLAKEILSQRYPQRTEKGGEVADVRRDLVNAIRSGKDADAAMKEAEETGKVTHKQAFLSKKKALMSEDVATLKALSIDDLNKVFEKATPDEIKAWEPIYESRVAAAIKESKSPLRERTEADVKAGRTVKDIRDSHQSRIDEARRKLKAAAESGYLSKERLKALGL